MGVGRFRWRVEGLAVGWGVGWGLCGIGPALAGKLGGGSAFALRAGFFCGSLPMLAPARSRCRWLGGWCGRGVRLSAYGYGCAGRFLGFSWGVCAVVLAMGWDAVGGSAGSVLRSQGSSGEDELLRCAQVFFGSLPMLAPDRSRCRWLGVWCGRGVRLSAFGYGCAERFLGFSWGGALWFWRWGGMPWGALRDRSCGRRGRHIQRMQMWLGRRRFRVQP